jgi:predicted Zn-dependent peptidase
VVDPHHIDIALDMLSDILINSTIPVEEVEKERGVIIEEINMYLDDPMRHIGDLWEKLLYGDQPSGWFIAGEKEIIASMPREEFVRYFHDQYTAPNSIVCVAGNFDTKDIRKKIGGYFENTPARLPKRKNPKTKEEQSTPNILIEHRKTDQMHLMLGVRGYNIFDPRKYALSVLEVILGGNMSSRLWHEIRERRGLAYYVSSENESYTDSGFFVTRAGVNVSKAEETIKLILKEYRNIAHEGVKDEELRMAKSFLTGKLHLGIETASQKASFMGQQEVLINKVLTPKEIERNILKVSSINVTNAARDIFKNNKLNLCLVGPVEDEAKLRALLTFNK